MVKKVVVSALILGIISPLLAVQTLPEVMVLGQTQEAMDAVPGSTGVVDKETLERSKTFTTYEALRKVSGVRVREDSGIGPINISIRGLDDDRSRKVLLLEDGVPLSLAPYGEASAYYSPVIDRIDRIEVRKGSGSILYGPQTIGGVVNFVTAMPTETPETRATVELGNNKFLKTHYSHTGTYDNMGLTLDVLHRQGDGPRAHMPYKLYDVSGKVFTQLSPASELILRGQFHNRQANVSYLGLNQAMFSADPNQNPVQDDTLYTRRIAGSATHRYKGFESFDLETTVYAYTTTRDWWRQGYSYGSDGSINLREETDGRNRTYQVVGVEPRITTDRFRGGLRAHYELEHNARPVNTTDHTVHAPTSVNSDELRHTTAAAAFGEYDVDVNEKWRLTPGMRVESFRMVRDIRVNSNAVVNQEGSAGLQVELIPGLGTTYDLNDDATLFAGVHRGFAPPRFADAVNSTGQDQQLEAERSMNYEFGVRSKLAENMNLNATAFYIDYRNQIVNSSESIGTETNAGQTSHVGVELDFGSDYEQVFGSNWTLSPSLALAYTQARVVGDRVDGSGNNLQTDGEPVPYAPEETATIGLALSNDKTSYFLEGVYVGDMRAYDIASQNPHNRRDGSANGRTGDIPSHFVVNLSARYMLKDNVELFGAVKNLFDEVYIASRRPRGIFPGPERQINFGVTVAL